MESYREAADIFVKSGFIVKAIAVCKLILTVDPTLTDIEKRLAELYARSKPPEALPPYEPPPDAAELPETIGLMEPPERKRPRPKKRPPKKSRSRPRSLKKKRLKKRVAPAAPSPTEASKEASPAPSEDTGLLMGNEEEKDEEDTIEFELVADQAKAEVERIEQAQADEQEKTERERAELEKAARAAKDEAKRLEDEKKAGEEKALEEHKKLEKRL